MATLNTSVRLFSLSSALFLSGYHYASDAVALPNTTYHSLSTSDKVRAWYRAWDVGRVVGPLCVNVALIGNGVSAILAGPTSPTFWLHIFGSALQIVNVTYTVFLVFEVNDQLLARHERVKKSEDISTDRSVDGWIMRWKAMDRKRMCLMLGTAAADMISLALVLINTEC